MLMNQHGAKLPIFDPHKEYLEISLCIPSNLFDFPASCGQRISLGQTEQAAHIGGHTRDISRCLSPQLFEFLRTQ